MSKMSPQLWFQRSPCTADNRAWHKPWDSFDYRWGFYRVPTRWRAALSPPRVWWRSCFKVPPFDGRVVVFLFPVDEKTHLERIDGNRHSHVLLKIMGPYPNRHLLGVAKAIYFHYGVYGCCWCWCFFGGKAAEVGKVGGWVSACIWCVLVLGSGWTTCGCGIYALWEFWYNGGSAFWWEIPWISHWHGLFASWYREYVHRLASIRLDRYAYREIFVLLESPKAMTQMQVCPDLVRCNHLFFHGIRSWGDSNDRGVFSFYCVYTGIWLAGITYTSEQCTCQNSEHLFTVVAEVMPVPYISCKTQDTWHNCHMDQCHGFWWVGLRHLRPCRQWLVGLGNYRSVSGILVLIFWVVSRFADVASFRPES